MEATLAALGTGKDGPVKLTCVLTNGTDLFGFRHATSGAAPTLYASGVLDNGGRAMASEPLCGVANKWEALPENRMLRLDQMTGRIAA